MFNVCYDLLLQFVNKTCFWFVKSCLLYVHTHWLFAMYNVDADFSYLCEIISSVLKICEP